MDDWVKAGGGGEWSRRRFLLQTAKFSAFAFLGSPLALAELPAPSTLPDPKPNHMMLGDWGTVTEPGPQIAVANAMKQWVSDNGIRPDALLMLGDNFYGEMPDGVNSYRWIKQFEQMYPSSSFLAPHMQCLAITTTKPSVGTRLKLSIYQPEHSMENATTLV